MIGRKKRKCRIESLGDAFGSRFRAALSRTGLSDLPMHETPTGEVWQQMLHAQIWLGILKHLTALITLRIQSV